MSIIAPHVRKHLSADALFALVRSGFAAIPAPRRDHGDISLTDALMSAFAMFSLKAPSLLAFDKERAEGNSICEVSHWFDQCDLNSFERTGSRVLLGWLDEPTQGELDVRSLSEPDAFPVELQVSCRLRAQTAA